MPRPIQTTGLFHGLDWRASSRRYLLLVSGSGGAFVLTLLIVTWLSRALGPEGYGRLSLFIAIAQTVVYLTSFWSSLSLLKLGSEDLVTRGTFHRVFWARWIILVPLVSAAVAWLWSAGVGLGRFHLIHGALGMWIVLYSIALLCFQTAQVSYQASQQIGRAVALQIGERAILWLGVAAISLTGIADRLSWMVRWHVVAATVMAAVALVSFDRSLWLPVRTDGPTLRRFIRFSWPLIVAHMGAYLMMDWVDLAFLRHWRSMEEVGRYHLAYQIMGTLQQIPVQTLPITLPVLVGLASLGEQVQVERYYRQLLPQGLLGMTVLVCITMLLLPWALPRVFGTVFAGAIEPAGILMLALLLSTIFMGLVPLLKVDNRTPMVMLAFLAGGTVKVIVDWWGIPRWGALGAAWATVAAHAVCTGVVVAAVARQVRASLRIAVPMFACALCGYVGFSYFHSWLWRAGMVAVIGVLLVQLHRRGMVLISFWRVLTELRGNIAVEAK